MVVQEHNLEDILTKRELEVFNLVKQGMTSKQIGEQFGISYRTIEIHRSNIIRKLGIYTRSRNALQEFTHGKSSLNGVPLISSENKNA